MSKKRGKHKEKIDVKNILHKRLNEQFKPGFSKSDEPKAIRSFKSLENYKNITDRYIKWCSDKGIYSLDEMPKYITDYLFEKKDKDMVSNATIKTYRTGLCRVFEIDSDDITEQLIYKCHTEHKNYDFTLTRSDLKRSRNYYENRVSDEIEGTFENDLKIVACACGLRRAEFETLCPEHIFKDENGNYFLNLTASKKACEKTGFKRVNTKGGRDRIVEILPDKKAIDILMKWAAGKRPDEPLLTGHTISKNQDVHSYRAIYANLLYSKYARPVSQINQNKRIPAQRKNKSADGLVNPVIHLTRDLNGYALDRETCRLVSQNLGHNREEIFQTSYFRTEQIDKSLITLDTF